MDSEDSKRKREYHIAYKFDTQMEKFFERDK